MIAINFVKKHLSIKELLRVELLNFSIITGVNGSGKSHLLKAIENGSIQVEGILHGPETIRLYDWTSLTVHLDDAVDLQVVNRRREKALDASKKEIENFRNSISQWFTNHDIKDEKFKNVDWLLTVEDSVLIENLNQILPNHKQVSFFVEDFRKTYEKGEYQIFQNLKPHGNIGSTLIEYAREKKCSLLQLNANEINNCLPLTLNSNQTLQFRFAELFTIYHAAWEKNISHRYYAQTGGETDLFWLEDEDFIKRFGPKPWELANLVLQKGGFRYRFNYPKTTHENARFILRLTDPDEPEIELKVSELSSGERILLSIILLLYQATTDKQLSILPKLLLLDEIDAPLHPSFTKLLIEILKETLVDKYKLKILLTTHSPSTVALAPKDSIFELKRNPTTLDKCSQTIAIQKLTAGFITVLPSSSRIVIVESNDDASFYSELHNALISSGNIDSLMPLSFIPCSKQDNDGEGGGVSQVKNWAPKLNDLFEGLGFRGLIDWDSGRKEYGVIKVLKRYSIENYLLDPLTIISIMIKDGVDLFNNCPIPNMNFHKVIDLSVNVLQELVNNLSVLLENKNANLLNFPGKFEVEYLFGKKLNLPCWFRDCKGHDLIKYFKQTLNPIWTQKRSIIIPENDPHSRLLEMQTKCLPLIIPIDIRDIYLGLKK